MSEPSLSVCLITYNHANYISEAIDGVLMQRVNFSWELIIADDFSTDGTREIVLIYKEKYPEFIKLILQKKNVGREQNWFDLLNAPAFKYIAYIEGDDYWTDPYKLQKQVDFMEANPDCSICFHAAELVYENNMGNSYIHRPKKIPQNRKFNIKHAILGGGGFMMMTSMLFRTDCFRNYSDWCRCAPVGDVPLMLDLAEQGNIGYLDENMCVHRELSNNSWSNKMLQREQRRKHYRAMKRWWKEFNELTEHRYSFYIRIKLAKNGINYWYAEIVSLLKAR